MQTSKDWNTQYQRLKNKEREQRQNLESFNNFLHSPEAKRSKDYDDYLTFYRDYQKVCYELTMAQTLKLKEENTQQNKKWMEIDL